ncbi:MAG: ribosomal protein S18-alanine N-acetyltransferase [Gaiellales bacterium]
MTLTLRALRRGDLDEVEAIEQVAYAAPWSRTMFLSELSKPGSRTFGAFDLEGILLGYLLLSRQAGDWHVMNVAVHPEHRRRGVASALIARMLEDTATEPANGYTLEVRVSNTGAVALYERFGFRVHGVRKGYYLDNREDALIMWRLSGDGNAG